MVNIWIVVGNQNSGKSSIVRALTGVGNAKATPYLWWVNFVPPIGMQKTFVCATSLQERPNFNWTKPDKFVEMIESENINCEYVIISLRYNGINGLHGAGVYINHFHSIGWFVNYAIMNNLPPIIAPIIPTIIPPYSSFAPVSANSNAAILRSAWGLV